MFMTHMIVTIKLLINIPGIYLEHGYQNPSKRLLEADVYLRPGVY